MDAREIIIRPIISEKSYRAIDTNRYSFEVNYRATKPHIRAAVAVHADEDLRRLLDGCDCEEGRGSVRAALEE